jgi:hypothetical protein
MSTILDISHIISRKHCNIVHKFRRNIFSSKVPRKHLEVGHQRSYRTPLLARWFITLWLLETLLHTYGSIWIIMKNVTLSFNVCIHYLHTILTVSTNFICQCVYGETSDWLEYHYKTICLIEGWVEKTRDWLEPLYTRLGKKFVRRVM